MLPLGMSIGLYKKEINDDFAKKREKVLPCQKKVVPLHPIFARTAGPAL